MNPKAKEITAKGVICDHCLGRQFRNAYKGKESASIGAELRKGKKAIFETDDCYVCHGLFRRMDAMYKKMKAASKQWEYNTFLVGCVLPQDAIDAEEKLWSEVGAENAEPMKREINRLLGSRLEADVKKRAEFKHPDIVIMANFATGSVDIQVNSMFIYGRYQKLVRGIPQTRWPCRECHGSGTHIDAFGKTVACEHCQGKGKMYAESVEEIISAPVVKAAKAEDVKLHGSGREDIDARMLGSGRPFVLEAIKPHVRNIDLKKLEKAINRAAKKKVIVSELRTSAKTEVVDLKARSGTKTYHAVVECGGITKKDVELLAGSFQNVMLAQRTPQRVSHRRADLVRNRKVISTRLTFISKNRFEAEITAEAGTYIKELISGDDGRTKPSFSEVIGKKCKCIELDVMGVNND